MNRPPPDVALDLAIRPQPDDTTCGPTCLHAIYRWYDDPLPLSQVIAETATLDGGGTLDVFLANHALRRGYRACIYTYNLSVFDPTWFDRPGVDIAERLRRQAQAKDSPRLQAATRGYLEYLELGGRLAFEDLEPSLLRRLLRRQVPILTGLSSTYLYRDAREYGPEDEPDDIRGEPAGHFVLLTGYRCAGTARCPAQRPSRTCARSAWCGWCRPNSTTSCAARSRRCSPTSSCSACTSGVTSRPATTASPASSSSYSRHRCCAWSSSAETVTGRYEARAPSPRATCPTATTIFSSRRPRSTSTAASSATAGAAARASTSRSCMTPTTRNRPPTRACCSTSSARARRLASRRG